MAMNARQTICKLGRTPALLALLLPLVAGSAAAATYNLVAMPFVKAMPDGAAVTMWGYALDVGAGSVPSVPGPPLVVPPGDTTLTVNLRNTLPEPVSVVIPGQAAAMTPVKFADSAGRQRVRSFTAEAAAGGGIQSYTWSNLKPGTYLYHSGTHPQVQVQMGLYGAMTRNAAAGFPRQAYPGVFFNRQVTLLFSEIDPLLHAAVAAGQYGPGMAMSSTIDYAPKYFLINGESFTTQAAATQLAARIGRNTLLRFLNAGLNTRSPVLQGLHMRLVAEDGQPYAHAREQYSVTLPALKTVDAIITPTTAARYPLYDRRLALIGPTSVTNPNSKWGGMLAFLRVPQ
jgi:FtsP/CotA-like multicopper oxidase with cupredoxin domain